LDLVVVKLDDFGKLGELLDKLARRGHQPADSDETTQRIQRSGGFLRL
jgi:hypothetical protein